MKKTQPTYKVTYQYRLEPAEQGVCRTLRGLGRDLLPEHFQSTWLYNRTGRRRQTSSRLHILAQALSSGWCFLSPSSTAQTCILFSRLTWRYCFLCRAFPKPLTRWGSGAPRASHVPSPHHHLLHGTCGPRLLRACISPQDPEH